MTRLLVLEGNTLSAQERAIGLGIRTNSGTYVDALNRLFPDIQVDVVQGTLGFEGLPEGASLSDYDGFVLGGSGLRCADEDPEVTNQVELLREYAKLGRPILGSCWGLQIAAIAAGGEVSPSPNGRELPVAHDVRLTDAGSRHPLFAGKPETFASPCTHFDEVSALPEGSVLLAGNEHSGVQAAIIPLENSEVWAVQYHPEFDVRHLADLLALYGDATINEGHYADAEARDAAMADFRAIDASPGDDALRMRTGLGDDILDFDVRTLEIANWVRSELL